LDSGIAKVELEPEKKRTILALENAQAIAYFTQFYRESKTGNKKKLMKSKFTNKETRVLGAIVKFAIKKGCDAQKNCKITSKELDEMLEKVTGVPYDAEVLGSAEKLGLLKLEGGGKELAAVFGPSALGRTVACMEALRKLNKMDENRLMGSPGAKLGAA